ncbi:transporter substrate-binding domain-containing protein [Pseudodesulfovibrio sp. zrk46]|uniref:substrate-binding periplasmic protein n=1 Tax=Pseudodesulfovibrio sp. zrk46 TaxID=2725288 RepID=UPI00144953F7|nr:transporter substrate-binding domain-containing protein [Pseudodesulfovibrio sp. zrk46]QJB55529.1 amino acid ABC transporter substrate-binding protein [Pseudodesulfovibrio sp. zrk46]
MRKNVCHIILGFWLLCMAAGLAHAQSSGSDFAASRPRLEFSTFKGGMGQLFESVISEAYSRLGYDIVIDHFPAQRALVMANEGLVDGEAGRVAVIEEHNHNLIRVPTPIYINTVVAYGRKGAYDPKSGWKGLGTCKVGTVLGYKFIESKTRGVRRAQVTSYTQLFDMLMADRVDVVVAERLESLEAYKGCDHSCMHMLSPPLAQKPMYHYLHKRHASLVPAVNKVLMEMYEDGTMAAIHEKHGVQLSAQ